MVSYPSSTRHSSLFLEILAPLQRSTTPGKRVFPTIANLVAPTRQGPVFDGPFQVQAAIAALHDEASSVHLTDWRQILALYDLLLKMDLSPMVRLSRTILRNGKWSSRGHRCPRRDSGRPAAFGPLPHRGSASSPLRTPGQAVFLPSTRLDLLSKACSSPSTRFWNVGRSVSGSPHRKPKRTRTALSRSLRRRDTS